MNTSAVMIGLVTMVLIILLRRAAPRLPGLIVAIALTSAIVALWPLAPDTIQSRFGALPDQLPVPQLPAITFDRIIELLPSAFVIAFVGACGRPYDRRQPPTQCRGFGPGCGQSGLGLVRGLPATGAIARTATIVRAGGKTPVAGIVHALTILLVMMLAAPLAGYLAMPALAGLLILTAWNMSEPHKWRGYFTAPRSDQFLLVLTLVLTVVADLTFAIGVGVAFGLAIRLRRRHVPPAD